MSVPRSPVSSPYAGGPNSPIASSKRPRPIKQDTNLPAKGICLPSLDANKQSKMVGDVSRVSGSLFSPVLQEDESHKKENEINEEIVNTNTNPNVMDEENGEDDDDDEDTFNPYLFMATLPPHASVAVKGKICLPPQIRVKPTLVLDLDETLVHCCVNPFLNPDLTFPVTFNGTHYRVYVRKRPFLDYFLETVSKHFEVVIFTASQKVYADVLLDLLDPLKKIISHRLFRDSCLFVQGNYLKDLSVLGRDLNKTILVDNSPHAYGYNLDNGVPIESWFHSKEDRELLKLIGFLKTTENIPDIRPLIRDHFGSRELVERAALGYPQLTTAPPF